MATVVRRRKKTIARADALLARRSCEVLARLMQNSPSAKHSYRFRVMKTSSPDESVGQDREDGEDAEVTLPGEALQVLASALAEMAKGHAVMTVPATHELTPQQAAGILGVSRPFLLQLIRSEQIPARFVGTHRRLKLEDILAYQAGQETRSNAMDELAAQAQELEMGY